MLKKAFEINLKKKGGGAGLRNFKKMAYLVRTKLFIAETINYREKHWLQSI